MEEERRRNKQSVAALFKDLNEVSLILGAKSDERLNVRVGLGLFVSLGIVSDVEHGQHRECYR